MFKFSQLFSKQKDDKIIIMGKSGSGKSFMAMQLAVNNKGTTILANGCEIAYKSYMESTYYPSIKTSSKRPIIVYLPSKREKNISLKRLDQLFAEM